MAPPYRKAILSAASRRPDSKIDAIVSIVTANTEKGSREAMATGLSTSDGVRRRLGVGSYFMVATAGGNPVGFMEFAVKENRDGQRVVEIFHNLAVPSRSFSAVRSSLLESVFAWGQKNNVSRVVDTIDSDAERKAFEAFERRLARRPGSSNAESLRKGRRGMVTFTLRPKTRPRRRPQN